MHAVAPPREYLPALQDAHDVDVPPLEDVPAAQLRHDEPDRYCPAAHEIELHDDAFAIDVLPIGHDVQTVDPAASAKNPAKQDVQALAPAGDEEPAAQLRHDEPERYCPAAHVIR